MSILAAYLEAYVDEQLRAILTGRGDDRALTGPASFPCTAGPPPRDSRTILSRDGVPPPQWAELVREVFERIEVSRGRTASIRQRVRIVTKTATATEQVTAPTVTTPSPAPLPQRTKVQTVSGTDAAKVPAQSGPFETNRRLPDTGGALTGRASRPAALQLGPALRPQRKLSELVADQLLDQIRAERLKPGDRIPSDRDLMDQLAVGRTTLRDAIALLAGSGVLDAQPRRGVFVSDTVRHS